MMFLKNVRMISFRGKGIALSRRCVLKIPKRNGYMVLVPEIGEDLPQKYPLLKEDKRPDFNIITVEKCIAAIGRQTLEFEEAIRTLEKKIENAETVSPESLFKHVLDPMEEMCTAMHITWGIAKVLYLCNQSLMPTQCYLGIHERVRRSTASKYISVPIYQACKSIINNRDSEISNEKKRILIKYVLEGKLNGLELSRKNTEKHSACCIMLMRKTREYAERVEAATNQYNFTIRNPAIVKDFPEEVLKAMVTDSKQYENGPWTVTLDPCIMNSFMEYCPDRDLRWKVWEANVIKASILQDRLVQTGPLLEEIRQMKTTRAEILGFNSYAELSMETKMAKTVENVYETLDSLLNTARPAQEYEIKELNTFANERGFEGQLQHWDVPFWSRRQLQSVYKYREEDLKKYFSLPKVLSGIFELIETLFSVKIVENNNTNVWHKDVRFFDMFDLKQSSTNPISSFYLDLYQRSDDKVSLSREIGYMVTVNDRSKVCGTKPLVALIFSFQPPVEDKPSSLSLRDVRILLQKFGHMLQHTLTTVEHADVGGLSFVEWDAALISDFFFENWLYEPFFLRQISCHEHTKQPLTTAEIETLKNVKTHLSGYNLCRDLYLSRFDLELHSSRQFWNTIMNRLWSKYFVIPQHKRDCHVCSFSAIFSGDYAAAYYSKVWSQMLAADLYDAFQETPSNDKDHKKEIGSRFRETFLSLGGSYSAKEIFRKFRGRDPNPKALLTNLGLDVKSNMLQQTINDRIEKS